MSSRALRLYRSILRAGSKWSNPAEAREVVSEARTLFRQNRSLTDPKEVAAKVFEAESRLELALHYGIAYPRHYNLPPGTTVNAMKAAARRGKRSRVADAKPAYMDSYYDNDGVPAGRQ